MVQKDSQFIGQERMRSSGLLISFWHYYSKFPSLLLHCWWGNWTVESLTRLSLVVLFIRGMANVE